MKFYNNLKVFLFLFILSFKGFAAEQAGIFEKYIGWKPLEYVDTDGGIQRFRSNSEWVKSLNTFLEKEKATDRQAYRNWKLFSKDQGPGNIQLVPAGALLTVVGCTMSYLFGESPQSIATTFIVCFVFIFIVDQLKTHSPDIWAELSIHDKLLKNKYLSMQNKYPVPEGETIVKNYIESLKN